MALGGMGQSDLGGHVSFSFILVPKVHKGLVHLQIVGTKRGTMQNHRSRFVVSAGICGQNARRVD